MYLTQNYGGIHAVSSFFFIKKKRFIRFHKTEMSVFE